MKNSLTVAIVFLSALLSENKVLGQQFKEVDYRVESGITLSDGDNTPFYLLSGRQGLSDKTVSNGYLRGLLFAWGDLGKSSPFTFGAGIDLIGASRHAERFFIQQFYVDFDFRRWLRLSIGYKERYSELKNQALSNGGLAFSGNARPIPQIRLEIPEFITLPGTHRWVRLRGHIAYGCFTDDDWKNDFTRKSPYAIYQKGVLYHSKAGFISIGNREKIPFTIDLGLEMYSQFGGAVYNHRTGKLFSMPEKFNDYLKAFIPMGGDGDTPETEQTNISGNQLGSWHFAVEYHLKEWRFRAYHEHFFEDHSSMFGFELLKNRNNERKLIYYGWKDGLTGIEIAFPENRFIDELVYEYLFTKEQSGSNYHDPGSYYPEQMSGVDDYYNHGIYSAWQHYGQAIGNPLLLSPLYNSNGFITFMSNRVIAHHIGCSGNPFPFLSYRLLFSHTRHWGTYYDPLEKVERVTSLLLGMTYTARQGWHFAVEGAYDRSRMIGNNIGATLTLRKEGIIRIKNHE